MKHMSRLARIERMVVLLSCAVLVVGVILLADLWDANKLRSDLRKVAQDEASSSRMRLHTFVLPGRLPKPGNYRLDRPAQPGAQPSTGHNSPGVQPPTLSDTL
jgi:hypothetical protein